MTTETVSQRARLMLADYMERIGRIHPSDRSQIIEGAWDHTEDAQAFARFEREIVAEKDAEIERLREALAPFARVADGITDYEDAEWIDGDDTPFQAGDFRRARTALATEKEG